MAKFNSITEQLKSKDCKVVLGVTNQARSPVHKRWKGLDVHITDAANESKDNIKYLATLEKSFETMYMGKPQEIIDCLPALMNNINWNGVVWCLIIGTASAWRARVRREKARIAAAAESQP